MLRFLTLFSMVAACTAWTTGSCVSSFGGSVLVTSRETSSNNCMLTMKKGKANVPPQMRSQYKRQQEMAAMREEMIKSSTAGDDGLPVFNLFVRTKKANMWYPCGSFKGDDRSGALAKGYADGGMLSGISKKQLDAGIAGSLYKDQDKLAQSIVRAYPQLKKSEFQYGYKLSFQGLDEKKASEITLVEPKEQKGFLDGIKNIFS